MGKLCKDVDCILARTDEESESFEAGMFFAGVIGLVIALVVGITVVITREFIKGGGE